jgi:hypothetical protein
MTPPKSVEHIARFWGQSIRRLVVNSPDDIYKM